MPTEKSVILYAAVTPTYICQRTTTYVDTSAKLSVRFVYFKNTTRYVFISYDNVHIAKNTV